MRAVLRERRGKGHVDSPVRVAGDGISVVSTRRLGVKVTVKAAPGPTARLPTSCLARSDLRLNPHLHTIALDGAFSEQGRELVFAGLGHLKTSEVGEVLGHAVRRIERHLDRRGLLGTRNDDLDLSGEGDPASNLATSAVSGQSPPAGPQSPEGRRKPGLGPRGWNGRGRHGSPVAPLPARNQRASTTIPHDPLRGGTRCGESMARARQRAASPRGTPPLPPTAEDVEPEKRVRKSGYRPWAELLERTFAVDVLTCPSCQGRMRLLAVVKNPASMARGQAA